MRLGLTSHGGQDRQKQRARKMAGDTIDRIGDTTTTADDRANRKRDLLDGPKEFDRVRIDRPKRIKLRIPTKSPRRTDMKSPVDSETMSPTFPI
ncbi:hypothetical protein [Bradyrhizobium nanningense]|uniref:hypothetical protein n=1 Tax=Bradyrhizobium nanningense TaxID=1325118 RepID=UPI001008B264|nr:hypothetical protein [Bradyrhizobium nanningense]